MVVSAEARSGICFLVSKSPGRAIRHIHPRGTAVFHYYGIPFVADTASRDQFA